MINTSLKTDIFIHTSFYAGLYFLEFTQYAENQFLKTFSAFKQLSAYNLNFFNDSTTAIIFDNLLLFTSKADYFCQSCKTNSQVQKSNQNYQSEKLINRCKNRNFKIINSVHNILIQNC